MFVTNGQLVRYCFYHPPSAHSYLASLLEKLLCAFEIYRIFSAKSKHCLLSSNKKGQMPSAA